MNPAMQNIVGNSKQRGFRLRCFLGGEFDSRLRSEVLKGRDFSRAE